MDLFAFAYWAVMGAFLGWGIPKLETTFRRILFGLCFGIIAETAMPFIRAWLLG